ncbi:unnamed protein product, partial [Amoebophrya sp. A25]
LSSSARHHAQTGHQIDSLASRHLSPVVSKTHVEGNTADTKTQAKAPLANEQKSPKSNQNRKELTGKLKMGIS